MLLASCKNTSDHVIRLADRVCFAGYNCKTKRSVFNVEKVVWGFPIPADEHWFALPDAVYPLEIPRYLSEYSHFRTVNG